MQIKKSDIIEIIKEELQAALAEGSYEDEIMKGEEEMERHQRSKDRPMQTKKSHHPDYPPKEVSQDEKRQAILAMLQSAYPGKKFRITDGDGNVLAQS